jgi:hypothetical protein
MDIDYLKTDIDKSEVRSNGLRIFSSSILIMWVIFRLGEFFQTTFGYDIMKGRRDIAGAVLALSVAFSLFGLIEFITGLSLEQLQMMFTRRSGIIRIAILFGVIIITLCIATLAGMAYWSFVNHKVFPEFSLPIYVAGVLLLGIFNFVAIKFRWKIR